MIKKILARILPWLLFVWFTLSCAALRGPVEPRVAQFECRVRALKPLVGEVLDAEQLARDLYAGRASLGNVLGALKATEAEIKALRDAFDACDVPPDGEPS